MADNPYAQFANPYTVYGTAREPSPQTNAQATQDTLQVDKLRTDLQNVPLDRESKQTNIDQNKQSMQNQRFNQNQGLRQEYNNLPEVKNYSVALQSLGTALKAPDTPQGDLATIYAYAKAADPGSVVREGEMDMATATASLPEKYKADALRLTQGKRLPPEVRTGLIETMRQSVAGMRQVYDQQRDRYSGLAQQSGQDPNSIVGKPFYDAYRADEEAYIKAHGGTPRDPNAPTVQQSPTETGFGLKQDANLGQLSQPQAQAYDAWFKANPNPTPDQLMAFGQTLNLNIPPENAKAIVENFKRTHGLSHDVQSVDPRVTQLTDQLKQNSGAGDAAALGAQQGVTLGAADEIASAGAALRGSLSGQGSVGDLYNVNEQANQGYLDSLQQQHPLAYGAGQVGGGAVLAPLTFGAQTPSELAALSGGMGAAAGFNGGSGGLGNRAISALEGGAAGTALGYAIPKALSKIPSRVAQEVPPLVDPQTGALNQPLEAMSPGQRVVHAEEYGVNLPADAAGGRTAAVIGKGLDIMPGSAGVMEDARRATESQVAAASDVVASRFGSSRTMNEAGSELQRGAQDRIERGKAVITKAYNAIPISDVAQATTQNTVSTLQDITSRFQSNPELAATLKDTRLNSYLSALQNGKISWKDLKDFRSIIGEKIGEMRFGEGSSTSDLRALYAGLSEDMRHTAASQGPRASAAFERANSLNRQNEEMIQGALTRILGKSGDMAPEKAAAAVQAMAKGGKSTGDLKTLAQIKSATVKSGAWDEISSTLIRLGGQPANSAGRDFSPQTFVNWYADMAEPARAMLFGGTNNDLRKALDGFVAVNQRLQKVNALRNASNSAGSVTAAGTVGTMALTLTNPLIGVKLAAVMGGNYGMAKVWTNPAAVRLITGYSKAVASGNEQAVRSQIGRISALASTNPDLREPLMALQQRLLSAANDNIGRAAASPQDDQANQQ